MRQNHFSPVTDVWLLQPCAMADHSVYEGAVGLSQPSKRTTRLGRREQPGGDGRLVPRVQPREQILGRIGIRRQAEFELHGFDRLPAFQA